MSRTAAEWVRSPHEVFHVRKEHDGWRRSVDPRTWSSRNDDAVLVVWPVPMPQNVTLEASQEIHQLAYEWAQALMRPRAYELANRIVSN